MYLPRVFTEGSPDGGIRYEQTAQRDYELLERAIDIGLRRNTPHTYDLGLTEIRSAIEQVLAQDPTSAPDKTAQELRTNLCKLLEIGSDYELQPEETIYRARIAPAKPLDFSEYDSPPPELAKPNRVAAEGDRVLCAAFDVETCLVEIRPDIDDIIHHRICVASLKSRCPLKLIDFATQTDGPRIPEVHNTLHAFFDPNRYSYHLTQLLSRFVKSRGYDGMIYPSAMECTTGSKHTWRNLALYGAPIAEKKFSIQSVNRVLIRTVVNMFDLGPVWDDGTKGNHLAPYLKGWIGRVMSD
jgi:hypothetical protein